MKTNSLSFSSYSPNIDSNNNQIDMRSNSYIGKIRKTFRMRSARHVVELRQFQIAQQQQRMMNQQQQNNTQTGTTGAVIGGVTSSSSMTTTLDTLLNSSNILNLIIPLLQYYSPMSNSSTSSSNNGQSSTNSNNTSIPTNTTNTTTSKLPSSLSNEMAPDYQQLILAALIEMRNSISEQQTVSSPNNVSIQASTPSTNGQESATNSNCKCIRCQLQTYIKATVTKVFESLLLAKELKEHRTAQTMTCQEKERISKDLLESEEFSERIRLFQSSNNSSLIQFESIVRNNIELFVMISNVIPQQRSVYIASFDLPTNK